MIYLDLDSTLNNLIFVWVDWLNSKEYRKYTVQDIKHWSGLFSLYEDLIAFLKEDKYKSVKLFNGAKELIDDLKQLDDVCILTNNYEFTKIDKIKWLCKQNLNVPVVFTEHNKVSYLDRNDVFVDDKLETVLEAEKVCDNVFLYNHNGLYKYNKGNNKKTVCNFDELLQEVRKVYNKSYQKALF